MSLQDESFPDDDFLKELEYSINHGRLFQFPNRRKSSAFKTTKLFTASDSAVDLTTTEKVSSKILTTTAKIAPAITNANTSASSNDQQNLSTEAVIIPSEMSGKTAITSEPIGFEGPIAIDVDHDADDGRDTDDEAAHRTPVDPFHSSRKNKSTLCRDIHSEYTKRRYRHVESKVGQYIASMKAEEQKRRAKFQGQKSMPTSQQQHQHTLHHSTTDLYKLDDSATTDIDAEVVNSLEHMNVMTNSAITSSHGGAASISGGTGRNNVTSRHECSDEAVSGADFIDKMAYAQLVEEKEYIEMKLKEKSSENIRLKRNVDYMRIELSNCQDKLKRLSSISNLSNRSSLLGFSYCGSGNSIDVLGRYGNPNSRVTKATQTDYSAVVLRTPIPASLKPDSNSSAGRLIGSNVLRQRSNSNSSAQKLKNTAGNFLRPSYLSSTDTGFVSQFTDSCTTNPNSNKILSSSLSSSPGASPKSSPSSTHCKKARGARIDEYNNYYDRRSVRYLQLAMLNDSDESDIVFNENGVSECTHKAVPSHNPTNRNSKSRNCSTSLRRRFMRLLGRCTYCGDLNQTFDDSKSHGIEMIQPPAHF